MNQYKMPIILGLLLLLLTINSCIQHHYRLLVHPDGMVEYAYTAEGDSLDIYDQLNALPQPPKWEVATESRTDSGKKEYSYRAEGKFSANDKFPVTFGMEYPEFAQVYLQHPLEINRRNLFFMVAYNLEFTFRGRDFLMDSSSAEMVRQWFFSSLEEALEMHPEISFTQEKLDSLEDEIDEYLNFCLTEFSEDEAQDLAYMWALVKDKGYRLIEEQLNFLGDTTFFLDMEAAGEVFSREYLVTCDLADEGFMVDVQLPGKLTGSNADTIFAVETAEGNTANRLHWEFNGADLADSTIVLTAASVEYRMIWIIPAGIVLVGLIISFFVIRFKNRKANI